MIKEDIPLYKLDLEGNSPYNKVDRESFHRVGVKNNNILIPQSAPFFQKSLRVYDKSGKPLIEGTDYELYGIMGKLTQFTAKPVGLFVRILKDEILEGYFDYQVVGNFNKITNEILNMLHSIYEDDRFVMYENIENKPLWFIPEIHKHDLAYQIYGFTDFVRELNRVAQIQAANGNVATFMVETLRNNLEVYIAGYKDVLMKILDGHIGNLHDAHGTDKSKIGLGLVENYAVATLEETLEGLRDDLNITPYLAAQAADAASGRNERLLPAGSLPILRYGSDTFIPPTISGSFEGLGGLSKRHGAILETDGTLLILQPRTNGKVRGLYFIRATNWQNESPLYDFTAYRYLHPTATADGATLDTIINGSNRYVMVVGDSIKNIWYWCETHGTFNPDRHVLRRISGEWVDIDLKIPARIEYDFTMNKATLLADENYRDYFCILQCYTLEQLRQLRPNYLPEFNTPTLNWLGNSGYSFNIIADMGSEIKKANVDYSHPVFGKKYVDKYFTPQIPETVMVDGVLRLKSLDAIYNPPIETSQLYRGIHAYWLNNGNAGEYAFTSICYVNRFTTTGTANSNHRAFRGTLKLSKVGSEYTVNVVPGPGSDKLYEFNLATAISNPNNPEWQAYNDNVSMMLVPEDLDSVGSALIAPGVISYSNGQANASFPSNYVIANMDYVKNHTEMLKPRLKGTNGGYFQYGPLGVTVVDLNPVGLGTLFQSQTYMAGDTDDYTKGGMIARQNDEKGSYWVFRTMNLFNSNWEHAQPPEQGLYTGKSYLNYRFIPSCYKTNIKNQVALNSPLPMPGANNNKDRHKFIFSVNSDTNLMGESPLDMNAGRAAGDCKWVREVTTKLVNGTLTFTPTLVINMRQAIARDLVPLFAEAGLTSTEVINNWNHAYVFNAAGAPYSIFMVVVSRPPVMLCVALVARVDTVGTPDLSKGYTEYADCSITRISPNRSYTIDWSIDRVEYNYPKYNDVGSGYSTLPLAISVPYRNKESNGTIDSSAFVVNMSSNSRILVQQNWVTVGTCMEIRADGGEILAMGNTPTQNWGADGAMTPTPYYGFGNAFSGRSVFGGAAIGCDPYKQSGSMYANVVGNVYEGTPVIGFSNILAPQYTVYFQKIENVLLAGKMYNMEATYIDILDQDPNPANKIFWVYLTYLNGKTTYVITNSVRPETSTQSLIAKVVAGPTQIDSIIPYNRFSIDGASISAVRQGSSILATSGSLYDVGDTSSILVDNDFVP